jgi:1-acyl-sn-glycerol-3-phosphate acyltransferase
MEKTPFLGQITKWGGSLYTNRKQFANLKQEIEQISDVLKEGSNLVLFPEGTSFMGDTVHPFKKSLFEAAILSKVPIQPVCIKYQTIDDMPVDESNRDEICWYGDMAFVPHFPNLLKHRKFTAQITVLEEIPITPNMDRQEVSDLTFQAILQAFNT